MTQANKEVLIHRFKSFLWRAGGMLVIMFLEHLMASIGLFDLDPFVVTMIGLLVGETTKYLKVNLPELRASKEEN